jgi:nucleotide-binding universal stress UspA family protein
MSDRPEPEPALTRTHASATLDYCTRHIVVAVDDSEARGCFFFCFHRGSPIPCSARPSHHPASFPYTHTPNTQDAEKALAWVIANMARAGDGIHLVHAVPEPEPRQVHPGMFLPPPGEDDGEGEEEEQATTAVAMIRTRFVGQLTAAGLPFEVHLISAREADPGDIAAAVSAKADALGAAAVVVAHHPASPLRAWWRGSVAADVAKKSKVPTLVVH